MCGIWGIIPGLYTPVSNVRKFVTNCLIAGTVRGDHGSGLMLVGDARPDIIKGVEDGAGLLQYAHVHKSLSDDNLKSKWAIVGHNRAATRGLIDDESAHPFQHGDITLVHNGYVVNAEYLPGVPVVKGKDERVDSDMLTMAINAEGYDKILTRIYGAFALSWHDTRDNSLRFFRNNQRPLHMMRLNCGGIAFASEGDMLWWLAGRASLGRSEVRELATDTLLTITSERQCSAVKVERPIYQNNYYTPERSKSTSTSGGDVQSVAAGAPTERRGTLQQLGLSGSMQLEFEIYRIEEHHGTQVKYHGVCYKMNGKDEEVFNAIMYGHPNTNIDLGDVLNVRAAGVAKKEGRKATQTPVLIVRPFTRPVEKPQEPATPYTCEFIGPKNTKLTKEEWVHAVADGCTECRKPIAPEDAADIVWIFNETRPLCPSCTVGYQEMNPAIQRSLLQ